MSTGKVCLDVGASTGGFTDCLLQRGAARVHAVDVGRGQLDWKLRNDPRVVVHEGINARYLQPEDIGEPVDLIVCDVSFISVTLILPAAVPLLRPGRANGYTVKPQFEVGKGAGRQRRNRARSGAAPGRLREGDSRPCGRFGFEPASSRAPSWARKATRNFSCMPIIKTVGIVSKPGVGGGAGARARADRRGWERGIAIAHATNETAQYAGRADGHAARGRARRAASW